ncbi:hypothetical protein [Achromobacter phage Motura]|uniref:Uncharacterized protein n=1 Tax=Achromobacter phage Motura TaxID=2591403 RepID=A0A514CSS0_9CAUD|nr:hypothetical protein H1O15_gp285 [Achromobacter phage Motura]QDH83521.1 hypothetical protein [Achromobacter phage Motura]
MSTSIISDGAELELSAENTEMFRQFLLAMHRYDKATKNTKAEARFAVEDCLGNLLIKCQRLENEVEKLKCTQSQS